MLYDILFIDDDFDKQSDSNDWGSNAQKLFLELIQKNLRVTYTTGEMEDLERLESKDLSCIKYIFCDLHLLGIKDTDRKIKDIRSKLIGIFEKLNENIKSEHVTVFINSKFSDEWKSIADDAFKKSKVNERYTYKLVKNKNNLSNGDEKKLLKNNLNLHIKSLIIAKALEVEEVFDKKLELIETAKEQINFKSKHYVFQSQFYFKEEVKKEVKLLQQIRNKVAHTDNDLKKIKNKEMKRTFWKICSKQQLEEAIEFEDFQQLIIYIESIERLKCDLSNANAKRTP